MIKFNTDIRTTPPPYRMYKGWWAHETGHVVSVWVQSDAQDTSRCFARVELPHPTNHNACMEQLEMLVQIAEERFKCKVKSF